MAEFRDGQLVVTDLAWSCSPGRVEMHAGHAVLNGTEISLTLPIIAIEAGREDYAAMLGGVLRGIADMTSSRD